MSGSRKMAQAEHWSFLLFSVTNSGFHLHPCGCGGPRIPCRGAVSSTYVRATLLESPPLWGTDKTLLIWACESWEDASDLGREKQREGKSVQLICIALATTLGEGWGFILLGLLQYFPQVFCVRNVMSVVVLRGGKALRRQGLMGGG